MNNSGRVQNLRKNWYFNNLCGVALWWKSGQTRLMRVISLAQLITGGSFFLYIYLSNRLMVHAESAGGWRPCVCAVELIRTCIMHHAAEIFTLCNQFFSFYLFHCGCTAQKEIKTSSFNCKTCITWCAHRARRKTGASLHLDSVSFSSIWIIITQHVSIQRARYTRSPVRRLLWSCSRRIFKNSAC